MADTEGSVADQSTAETCWVCGAVTLAIRCKIVCPQCGYTRDCSDP